MEPVKPADGRTIGGLPIHLTEKILGCISPLESVRFAAVCKSWAEIISERLARPTPHLFALEVLHGHRRGAIFSAPIDDGGDDSPAPVVSARLPTIVSDAKYFGLCGVSPNGSLSFVNKSRVVIVNPVTGAFRSTEISTSEYRTEPKFCTGAEAIFIRECFERSFSFSLWWDTEEWSCWKLLLPKESGRTDAIDLMAYSDGVLYGLDFDGFTNTINTRALPPWRLTRFCAPSILKHYAPIRGRNSIINCHLLESEGEVMFVGPVITTQEPESIGGFEVYRLDVEGARWVKLERLTDDRALFVSMRSSFSVRASEMPGCMSNCIYFVDDRGEYLCGMCGVYSMEQRKVLFQRPVGGSPRKYKSARWFFPGVVIPLAHTRMDCTSS